MKRNDIDEILACKKLPLNFVKLNFNKENDKVHKIKIYKTMIDRASLIFAKDLVDYAKNGGDMKSLTVKNVYGKNEN